MAQWLGQFAGDTHATRVEDAEETLRHAVGVYAVADSADRAQKLKALQNMAGRVLRARLQFLKASIVSMEAARPSAESRVRFADRVERLQRAQEKALTGGLSAVLVEFGAGKGTEGAELLSPEASDEAGLLAVIKRIVETMDADGAERADHLVIIRRQKLV